MKKLLLMTLAIVLSACSDVPTAAANDEFALPAPVAQPKNIFEAVEHLPLQISYFSSDSNGKINVVGGTGTATPIEVMAALARMGVELEPQNLQIKGVPSSSGAAPAEFGLKATLNAPTSGQSGQTYSYSVQLFNSTNKQRSLNYGETSLDLIISKNGQHLRWASSSISTAVGHVLHCPPMQACQGEISGQV